MDENPSEPQESAESSIDPRGIKLAYTLCIIFGAGLIIFILIPPLVGLWTWNDVVLIVCLSLLFIAPAYATNASMVIFGRNGTPIDGGRKFRDGKRVLGNGKTWQGFIGGVITGTITGVILIVLSMFLIWPFVLNQIENPLYPMVLDNPIYLGAFFNPLFHVALLRVFLVSLGAPLGDLIGSFFKRRLNLERGAPAPIIDQLDFLLGAIFLAYIIFPLDWMYILFALLITLLLHVLANTLAYKLGYSKEPW